MKLMTQSRGGFTLIELLVVIAIIGLLSSIVFAGLGGARKNGRIAAAQGNLRNLTTALIVCQDLGAGTTVSMPTESNNGGAGPVCSNAEVTNKYVALPSGWTYCATAAGTACTLATDLSVASPLKLVAKGDGVKISCSEDGCVKE